MWELDHKESWVPKNWHFPIVVLEKTLESSLDRKEIKLVTLKGNPPWILTERTDAEVPILWLPGVKSGLIGKDPDLGEDWGQEEKGATEDETVGWHHRFNGQFEQIQGDREFLMQNHQLSQQSTSPSTGCNSPGPGPRPSLSNGF